MQLAQAFIDRGLLVVTENEHAGAARLDFARQFGEFFLILFRLGSDLFEYLFGSRAHKNTIAQPCRHLRPRLRRIS